MKALTHKFKWSYIIRSMILIFVYNASVLYANSSVQSTLKTEQSKFKVTGIVSESGDPMPGVNVTVKGTTIGTISDLNGSYSIEVPDESTYLSFSFLGYTTKDIQVGKKRQINVDMVEDAYLVDEVVVVGYGTQSKRNVSGSLSNVNSDVITRSTSTSISGALAGKIQGISTRATDARPGNGTSLQIRNMGNPLYVIDGIPYGGLDEKDAFGISKGGGSDVFNQLTQEDVESITILKDASAAVYGLRAANGVVLVTTKKGSREEKVSINVNGYYGVQNFTRYPQPANAYQFIRAKLESEQNWGRDPEALYSPEELSKWKAGTEKGYKSYDYYDIVRRKNVPQYNINANVSGGTKNSNYYLSVAHTNQEAIIRDFTYDRTNLQANIDAGIAQGLTVGAQISFVLEKNHNVGVPGLDDYFNPLLSVFSMWPTESPYANDNPKYIHQTHNVNVNPATYRDDVTGWLDNAKRKANINVYAKYDFKFGLSAKATYSYNYSNEEFDGMEYTYSAYKYDDATDTYITDPTWGNQNPWREKHKRSIAARFVQFQLNYQKEFNGHYLSAVAAYEASDYENNYMALHTVPSNNYVEQMLFSEQDYLADDWFFQARQGYIGRINYNYHGKYLVELLGRYDASYLYHKDNRWGFFPGISLGWRLSDEKFFEKLKPIFNDVKIRLSYGQTGSEEGVSQHGFLPGYDFNSGSAILDNNYVIGLRPRGLPVKELSWVRNKTTNIGFDFSFLENRLTFTTDLFERKRTGVPAPRYDVVLPIEVGYTLPNENLNSDAIRGLEGIVTYSDKAGNLHYSVSANATYARKRMLDSYRPRFGNSWQEYRTSTENRWADIDWGYQIIGRFESMDQINNYPVNIDGNGNRTLLPGDFIYKDANNDGIINNLDERPIGYALGQQPFFSYGLNTTFEWKGISLYLDFAGASMQTFRRNWELKYPFQNNGSAPDYMFEDRWHREDPYDPDSKWIPGKYPAVRQGYENHSNFKRNNDFWDTNVKYFRLKTLEVGYSLPKNIISKFGANKLRVYVNATNLFSFDNVKDYGIDPEISSENGLVYPQQRLLLAGFNLSF